MTFISSIKRALGFPGIYDGDDDLEDDILDDDDLVDDPDPIVESISAANDDLNELPENKQAKPCVSDEDVKALTSGLFDSVLNYFNNHQPELVQRCLDMEAQRKLIVDNMDTDLRERINALAEKACRQGENLWAEKQQRMGAELLKLKSEYNSVRQQREEYQSAQLSATRQKRALTDRIRDLESQVTNLEAEREQYQLENKSMANRLMNMGAAASPAVHTDHEKMVKECQVLKAQNEECLNKIHELEQQLKSANAEVESLKTATSTPVLTDTASELAELEGQIIPLRQLKDAAEAKVISLTKELKECDSTITTLQKRLGENAHEAEEYERTIENLRTTIEKNLHSHATAQAELKKEISELKASLSSPSETALFNGPDLNPVTTSGTAADTMHNTNKKKRKKRRKRHDDCSAPLAGMTMDDEQPQTKISAIDELMESTDWFVAPDPVPLKKDPEVEENFGYKEPLKKNETPSDDRQLTLW